MTIDIRLLQNKLNITVNTVPIYTLLAREFFFL